MKTYLAAVGDANDPRTWSGIPYHFLQAARPAGLIDEGLPLDPDTQATRARRAVWNAWSLVTGSGLGGFQYSDAFLERLWSGTDVRDARVVNCFQLYPLSVVRDARVRRWSFIDQTLTQLFDVYGARAKIGRAVARRALALEREGYRSAEGIVAHSRWAAKSVIEDYGVDPARVHVIQPGANLDPRAYATWEATAAPRFASEEGLRLVCVGKDWRRKGIDRLLLAFREARRSQPSLRLRLIGCPEALLPPEVRGIDGVEYAGFLDKRTRATEFMEKVAECDVGCLVSRAEAGGIALREYHALGLPTLATDAGGAPEHALASASVSVPHLASPEELAGILIGIASDAPRLRRLKEAAWKARGDALWARTIERLAPLLREAR